MFLLKILALSSTSIFSKQAWQNCLPTAHLRAPPATPCYNSAAGNCSDVHARTLEDIQAAVKFVAKHNLRLVIKGTGNDHLGRSSGRGSFMIWTHHLKNITFHDSTAMDSVTYDNDLFQMTVKPDFPLTRISVTTVFTFGAGVQWFETYEAVKKQNRLIVGYVNGNHVIANAHQNSDLFWALRGGGGGTWGVATSVTYKTHPSTPFSTAFFSINSTNAKSTRKLLTEVIRLTPLLSKQGYGGFGGVSVDSFQMFVASPNVTANETQATFLPFFEFVHSQPGVSVQNGTQLIPDWWQFYDGFIAAADSQFGDGFPREVSNWFLPKDVIETDKPEELAAKLLKTTRFSFVTFLYSIIGSQGGQATRVDPESTGFNPILRNTLLFIGLSTTWQDGADSTEINAARQVLIHDMKIVEGIAPESGASLVEASRHEFDWKKSFFGAHYENLRVIKQKYDPQSLFLVYKGVASDEWDADLICRI